MTRLVRVVNGRPRLAVGALVSSFLGTLWLGIELGIIGLIDIFGSGLLSAWRDLGRFLTVDVIGRVFGIGADSIRTAWAQTISFNSAFLGPLAYPAAVLEVVAVTYLMLIVLEWVVGGFLG